MLGVCGILFVQLELVNLVSEAAFSCGHRESYTLNGVLFTGGFVFGFSLWELSYCDLQMLNQKWIIFVAVKSPMSHYPLIAYLCTAVDMRLYMLTI